MASNFVKLEKTLFRTLNSVAEPAVRRGIGSSRFTPASLIVLETTGFKSGQQRRTPLWSLCLGRYRIVSTGRGERSFWIKNLIKEPAVNYYLGGRRRESNAIVIADGRAPLGNFAVPNRIMRKLIELFSGYTENGWAFVILAPAAR